MPYWWPFAVGAAFLISAAVTPFLARLAASKGVLDVPGERKLHPGPTPLLGGVAIYLAFVLPVLGVLLLTEHLIAGEIDVRHFVGFFIGATVLISGGWLDDKYNLPPRLSILFPLLAATSAVIFGIGVEKITNPFGEALIIAPVISMLVTFVWLLAMTYTTKLLDGVDGLTTGVTLVGSIMIALLALSEKFFQPDVAVLALIFAAALIGFWLWNLPPATIFLGEGGSTLVGFTLGVLAIISGSKLATTLLVVGVPALDVAFVILRRWREGRAVTGGDRTHLHFLLKAAGLSSVQILVIYLLLASAFGVTTLLFASWQKLGALILLALLVAVGVTALYRYVRSKPKDTYETGTNA